LTELIEIAKLPEGEQESKYQQVQQNLVNEPMVIRLRIPTIIHDISTHRKSDAELRCAIVALAVERFRLANGQWPSALSDLTPAFLAQLPVDPFDGQPLHYRPTADGVMIYSIGPDGIDDGGTLDPTKDFGPGTDIGIQLWDVPK